MGVGDERHPAALVKWLHGQNSNQAADLIDSQNAALRRDRDDIRVVAGKDLTAGAASTAGLIVGCLRGLLPGGSGWIFCATIQGHGKGPGHGSLAHTRHPGEQQGMRDGASQAECLQKSDRQALSYDGVEAGHVTYDNPNPVSGRRSQEGTAGQRKSRPGDSVLMDSGAIGVTVCRVVYKSTRSLSSLPDLKNGSFLGLIVTLSPVLGLRPT